MAKTKTKTPRRLPDTVYVRMTEYGPSASVEQAELVPGEIVGEYQLIGQSRVTVELVPIS